MGNSNLLFESAFKRRLSDPGTKDYLVQITNEHPYFSPAQFFLLLLTEKGTAAYKKQAAKTAVLFNNAYWLQFQLNDKEWADEDLTENVVADSELSPVKEAGNFVTESHNLDEVPRNEQDGLVAQSETEDTGLSINEPSQQPIIQQPDDSIEDEDIVLVKEEPVSLLPLEVAEEPVPENTIEPVVIDTKPREEIYTDNTNEATTLVTETEFTENTVLNGLHKEEQIVPENGIQAGSNNADSINTPDYTRTEVNDTSISRHFNNENTPLVNGPEANDEITKEGEIAPLNFKLNIDTPDPKEENITFEPLHTSDYFASIGVKLSGEINPSDKLGKQLKSFTEWLKTMKKIHNGQQPVQLSGQSDISIQKLAEESNKDNAVVTEAMADVLLQQGKAEKAIEVYKKLSLLNPSKSIYFAAKIDQLKEH